MDFQLKCCISNEEESVGLSWLGLLEIPTTVPNSEVSTSGSSLNELWLSVGYCTTPRHALELISQHLQCICARLAAVTWVPAGKGCAGMCQHCLGKSRMLVLH